MKISYDEAKLEIIMFEKLDIITTSNGDFSIDDNNNWDSNGWT